MKNFNNRFAILITLVVFGMLTISTTFAQAIKLEEGTQIRLRLLQDLSSSTAQSGQTISFEVLDDVRVGDTVVITEGAQALGTIVEAEAKKSLGRAGKLSYRLDYVKAIDGSKIPIRAISVNKGSGKGTATGVAVGVSAVVFFPAAPAFLLIKGKDITVPRGQHIDAFIDGNRTIQANSSPSYSSGYGATTQTGFTQISTNSSVCLISIISDQGGEVEVDGVFFGSAPTTIKVPVGQHIITVKRNGYTSWQRSVLLAPGNITLKADLRPLSSSRSGHRR